MASMKLWKSSHGYGANQTKLSQYQHQENKMSQSTQSHQSHLGSSMHAFDQFGGACANNSTRYHAQANSVVPSPSIHVQETIHVTETLKRQESHTDQQWSTKNDTCPKPALSGYSAGGAMYEDGQANKLTQCSSLVQGNQHGQSMLRSQDDKSYKYNNANSFDGECLSPMKAANQHGQTMFKEQTEQSHKNSLEGDWSTKGSNYSGSNQFNHSTQNKYEQQDHHGLNDKANKFYSSPEMGHSDHAIHQEGVMMGSKGQSWVSSPTQPNQSSLSMNKSHYMAESVDHALVNSPTRANSSTFNMQKQDHMLGEIEGGLGMKSSSCSNAIKANQYGQSMYDKRQGEIGYTANDHGIHNGQSKNSGSTYQYGSSNTMYNGQDQYGQSMYQGRAEDVFNFNDGDIKSNCTNKPGPKQYNYSSNNIHKGQQEQYGSMMSHSGHSSRPYQYGSSHTLYNGQDQHGQSIYQAGREEDIFNFNDRDIQSDCTSNLGQKQYNYSSNNMHKGQDQYGSAMSHSGHSAYNKHHEYEDDNVDDIMDEILSKYPAHNVSGGYGSCASRPKQFSYASSTSSSSANKFEMRGMMNNGGFYNKNGIGNHYGCDY